ncbi:hypothetical protein Hanom_Chr10g00895981 [Helianthus anomalus]
MVQPHLRPSKVCTGLNTTTHHHRLPPTTVHHHRHRHRPPPTATVYHCHRPPPPLSTSTTHYHHPPPPPTVHVYHPPPPPSVHHHRPYTTTDLFLKSTYVKKQTTFFLQTAEVLSTPSSTDVYKCDPQTSDILPLKNPTTPKSFQTFISHPTFTLKSIMSGWSPLFPNKTSPLHQIPL